MASRRSSLASSGGGDAYKVGLSKSFDDPKPAKAHPFVRLGGFIFGGISRGKAKRKAAKEEATAFAEAEEEEAKAEAGLSGKRYKKPAYLRKKPVINVWPFNRGFKDDDDGSDSDDDDIEEKRKALEAQDFWEGDVSGTGSDGSERTGSEEWDGAQDDDQWEAEEGDFFRLGERHPSYVGEPIERLGPEDIRELHETMMRMQPNYKKPSDMILEEELERAVNARLARLKKANHLNANIAFGAPVRTVKHQTPVPLGNIKVPTLIYVTGHHGTGGNVGVNGIYERYPDDYHGRPVYQKYLEREEWTDCPQETELGNGERGWAVQDLDDEECGRTFPTLHDTPRTKRGLKHQMTSVKVLPCVKEPGAVGDFRFVDKVESWFLFFDDYIGAWCIGPRPGSNAVFARCFGVDESVPDNLGPERWQVFDVGHRTWYTAKHLRTIKGGAVSSAVCG